MVYTRCNFAQFSFSCSGSKVKCTMLSPYNTVAVVQFTSEVYSGLEEERSVSVCVVLSGTEVQVGNFLEIGYHTGGGTATGKVSTNMSNTPT